MRYSFWRCWLHTLLVRHTGQLVLFWRGQRRLRLCFPGRCRRGTQSDGAPCRQLRQSLGLGWHLRCPRATHVGECLRPERVGSRRRSAARRSTDGVRKTGNGWVKVGAVGDAGARCMCTSENGGKMDTHIDTRSGIIRRLRRRRQTWTSPRSRTFSVRSPTSKEHNST